MGHRCAYYSSIVLHGDELVHEVTAVYKKKKETVYEEHEDGNYYCRYIYCYPGCGYLVTFPGETLSFYYGYAKQDYQDLTSCQKLGISTIWVNQKEELKYIADVRPDLKYLTKKYKGSNPSEFIELVIKYKKNSSIESLVEMGLEKIALDKRLEKISVEKKKQVVNFIKNNKLDEWSSLTKILFCLKHNLKYQEAEKYSMYHYDFKLANYLEKQDETLYYYQDYKRLCKELDKNMKDDYWAYPSNLRERHNLLVEQVRNKREYELLLKKQQENERQRNISLNIEKIAKLNDYNNKSIDGFSIYIPSTVKDIQHQADVLNQCLISCNYPKKMANQKSILVFIKKEDNPIATAEIDYSKKILQFYADERDRNNCKPTKEVQSIFSQWLESAKIKKANLGAIA